MTKNLLCYYLETNLHQKPSTVNYPFSLFLNLKTRAKSLALIAAASFFDEERGEKDRVLRRAQDKLQAVPGSKKKSAQN